MPDQQNQNPYSQLVQGFLAKQQQMQPETEQPTPVGQPQNGGKAMPDMDITHPGVGSPTTQALMGALNNLNNFIKHAQDRDDISVAQTILSLVADLLRRDKTTEKQISGQGVEQVQTGT